MSNLARPLQNWPPEEPETVADTRTPHADPRHHPSSFEQLDWLDEHHHAVSALLMQRGFVPLYPQLVLASGSVKAALMLGQAIGLSRTWLQRDRSRNGWFWASAADWQAATSLTPREQEAAREALVHAGLWEERRTHNPSRLYFRVHLDVVASALGMARAAPERDGGDEWCWDDGVAANLLGHAQMFFKPLADLAGGVMPGLLLSQLLSTQRTALKDRRVDLQGQFAVQYDKLAQHLMLGTKVVRNARDQLRRAGFITEHVRGAGPNTRVHVGVNLTAMMACLHAQPKTAMNDRVAAARLNAGKADGRRPIDPRKPARKDARTTAGKRQSFDGPIDNQLSLTNFSFEANQGLAAAAFPQTPEPTPGDGAVLSITKTAPSQIEEVAALLSIAPSAGWCPFVKSDGAVLSVAYTENNDREPPPPEHTGDSSADAGSGRRISVEKAAVFSPPAETLVVPEGLDRAKALALVERAPQDLRQVVLDELAGHLKSKRKGIDSPAAYLRVLVDKAVKGSLETTVAEDVARVRRARAEAAQREAQAIALHPKPNGAPPAAAVPPSDALARLTSLRATLAGGAIPLAAAEGDACDQ